LKIEISVPEVVGLFKEIQKSPEKLFEMIRLDMRETVGEYLSALMKSELDHFLGRERYEREAGKSNHRNGSYERNFALKGVGEVKVAVPRDRRGQYRTTVIPRSKRYEEEIGRDLSLMFLTGISTRSLAMLSKRLLGRRISHAEISSLNTDLTAAVEAWRTRDLSAEAVKYIFVDGTNFSMRVGRSVETVPLLVAVGVSESGHKLVLGLQSGDKESASCWREFLKDLKQRGLSAGRVRLGVMDGLPGLEKVFKEEFSNSVVQRCQVHVAKNVLAKVPRKLKQAVADDVRSIFYASSKAKSDELFRGFEEKWEQDLPSAVKCLRNSLASCQTFYEFPSEEWISLRTTNIIERLNKEYKRRTKPMEIVAGENACYRLLAFISLKMELHWRSNPVGKVRENLPFFKELAQSKFTHKS